MTSVVVVLFMVTTRFRFRKHFSLVRICLLSIDNDDGMKFCLVSPQTVLVSCVHTDWPLTDCVCRCCSVRCDYVQNHRRRFVLRIIRRNCEAKRQNRNHCYCSHHQLDHHHDPQPSECHICSSVVTNPGISLSFVDGRHWQQNEFQRNTRSHVWQFMFFVTSMSLSFGKYVTFAGVYRHCCVAHKLR